MYVCIVVPVALNLVRRRLLRQWQTNNSEISANLGLSLIKPEIVQVARDKRAPQKVRGEACKCVPVTQTAEQNLFENRESWQTTKTNPVKHFLLHLVSAGSAAASHMPTIRSESFVPVDYSDMSDAD